MDDPAKNIVSLKNVISAWWKFFWRYAVLMVALLVLNGLFINKIGKVLSIPSLVFWGSISGNFIINILISLVIFYSIMGKRLGKADFIIIPASAKRKDPQNPQQQVTRFRVTLSWWNYFWRFAIVVFSIAAALGVLRMQIGKSIELPKYLKYMDNLAVIPASLLVFILLMWRKEKRRKLDLIPVSATSEKTKV